MHNPNNFQDKCQLVSYLYATRTLPEERVSLSNFMVHKLCSLKELSQILPLEKYFNEQAQKAIHY